MITDQIHWGDGLSKFELGLSDTDGPAAGHVMGDSHAGDNLLSVGVGDLAVDLDFTCTASSNIA